MADVRALVVAALAILCGAAHAGYAYPADPAGFSRTGGGYGYATSANDSWFGRTVHQPNGLRVPVPGRLVTMPVSYRLAANAPRVAAGVIFANPALRAALGIATWLGVANYVWDEVEKVWRRVAEEGEQYEFYWTYNGNSYPSADAACRAAHAALVTNTDAYPFLRAEIVSENSANCLHGYKNYPDWAPQNFGNVSRERASTGQSCPAGWQATPAGCLSPAVQQPQFEDGLSGTPMPESVPSELPYPTPLPVEPTPGPWVNPEPGPSPSHRPRFIPMGDPLPNPDYNPNGEPSPQNQPYIRPGIRINPSPEPDNPWRVDLEPVNRPSNNNDPSQGEENEPGENDKPKPEDQQSLCEKHPDIVACQKLGTLTPTPLQQSTVPLAINREEGFGPADGMCPAPKEFVIMGKQMAFRWDLLCDFATGIRPILIGFAYLSAVLAFMGLTRRGD